MADDLDTYAMRHFLPMRISGTSTLLSLPDLSPRLASEVEAWCVATLGYRPGIVWLDDVGLLFKTEADLLLFRLAYPNDSLWWE